MNKDQFKDQLKNKIDNAKERAKDALRSPSDRSKQAGGSMDHANDKAEEIRKDVARKIDESEDE